MTHLVVFTNIFCFLLLQFSERKADTVYWTKCACYLHPVSTPHSMTHKQYHSLLWLLRITYPLASLLSTFWDQRKKSPNDAVLRKSASFNKALCCDAIVRPESVLHVKLQLPIWIGLCLKGYSALLPLCSVHLTLPKLPRLEWLCLSRWECLILYREGSTVSESSTVCQSF